MSTPITPTRLQSLHSGLTLLAIALAPRSWRETVEEFVEHDCNPPSNGKGPWRCGCGREWR